MSARTHDVQTARPCPLAARGIGARRGTGRQGLGPNGSGPAGPKPIAPHGAGRHPQPGPHPAGGSARRGKDGHDQGPGADSEVAVPPRAVHARPDAQRHSGHAHSARNGRRRAGDDVSERPGVHQYPAGRRNQPRQPQNPVRPAGGDAGTLGDVAGQHPHVARSVLRAGQPEPDRVGGHVSAARGPIGPLSVQADRRATFRRTCWTTLFRRVAAASRPCPARRFRRRSCRGCSA